MFIINNFVQNKLKYYLNKYFIDNNSTKLKIELLNQMTLRDLRLNCEEINKFL